MFSKTKFKKVVKEQTDKFNSYLTGKQEISKKGRDIVEAVKVCSSHKNVILNVCGIMLGEDLLPYSTSALPYPILACIKLNTNEISHNYALGKVYMIAGTQKAIKETTFGNVLPKTKSHYTPVTNEEIDEYVDKLDITRVISTIIKQGAYTKLTRLLDSL